MFPFRRRRQAAKIDALYGAIVAQARRPAFYADYGVADTVAGRFDMVVLHAVLVLRRLRAAPEGFGGLGQEVFDAFCRDMDGNLREMGVGDLAVPRQMREFGEAFYGRAAAYDRALAADDEGELIATLGRNVFSGADRGDAARLAAYVREAERRLAGDEGWLATGPAPFPDPGAIAPAAAPRVAAC
ncbi:MAG: ubiquinol-cytochrome C chaperone [Xanthobacteraceae bacterium]|nr:ubiquinol-cytochrome C chaperone [Xanthobacteraceae bacterium]GIK80535.1 MAG: ubiquinol-cytochrome c chaperone [Alphaproteobacteria bacterium]